MLLTVDADGDYLVDLAHSGGREIRRWLNAKLSSRTRVIGGTYPNTLRLKEMSDEETWSDRAIARADELTNEYNQILSLACPRSELTVHGGVLSPAQGIGKLWLMQTRRGILADIMGSGKTVQTCAAAEAIQPRRLLIVCPLSVVHTWVRHLRQWTTLAEPYIYGGTREVAYLEDAVANMVPIIVPWSSLRTVSKATYWVSGRRSKRQPISTILTDTYWDIVIGDEAHRAKDPASQQTRCFAGLESEYLWLLTGTPLANKPQDLWALLRLVDFKSWNSKQRFIDDWCQVQHNAFGGLEILGFKPELTEKFAKFTADKILRRELEDVTNLRIEKHESQLFVDALPSQRRAIDQLLKEWLYEDEQSDKAITALNALMRLSMLFEVAQATPELDEDMTIKMKLPSPKITAAIDYIKNYDGPVVVFSRSRKLARLAQQAFAQSKLTVSYMDGSSDKDERRRAIEDFMDGKTDVFLATTKTASEGIDLSRARVILNLSGTWSLIDTMQASHRVIRPGQLADNVAIVDIITQDSIDERIYDVIRSKVHLTKSIDWRKVYNDVLLKGDFDGAQIL